MSRLRDQRGLSLIELMVTMVLLLIVMSATLDVLDGFVRRSNVNTKLNDAQDRARFTIDRLARQLRNLASPTNANANSIDLATDYDLVFQTVDPVKRRVRYCLNSANPSNATLWVQTQAFPLGSQDPGMPSTSSCPGPTGGGGWSTSQAEAQNLVNKIDGKDRNVFYYTGLGSDGDTSKITGIRADLYLDVNPGKPPAEANIQTGDFLRNQNQKPSIPDFGANHAGTRSYVFNGSDAVDPEGRTLEYYWYKGSGSMANLPSCQDGSTQTGGGFTCLGRGITVNHTFPATDSSPQSVTLKVVDAGGLSATLTKSVTLP
jgi:prepilin-type N-terminal cleavage/methylation domain-containing protein